MDLEIAERGRTVVVINYEFSITIYDKYNNGGRF